MPENTQAMQRGNSKQRKGRKGDDHRHGDSKQERRWGWVQCGDTTLLRYADDGFAPGSREGGERMEEAVPGFWFQWL